MQHLGLTPDEMKVYHRTLGFTHERRITVEVQTLEGKTLRSLTPQILDGQAIFEDDGEVAGKLDLRFLDPSRSLAFEPNNPSAAPLHRSRQVKVIDSRRIPALDRWVDCPVFTGPMWDFERDGAEVSIVAHGKERQGLGQLLHARSFAGKSRKTDAISTLLKMTGERHKSIPDLRGTLPNTLSIPPMDSHWPHAKRLADSMNRNLFYSGDGWVRMRRFSGAPVFTFDRHLLTEPTFKRSSDGVINVVEVLGANPKGPKRRVRARAILPRNHDLSPESLGRNGEPLYLIHRVENDHVKTNRDAARMADRILAQKSRTLVEISFESLPIPNLEQGDVVAVVTDIGTINLPLRKWSIPLGPDASAMTVGTLRRTTSAKGRHR